MNPLERRIILCLASVYGLRLLGLFMIVPVFALYARHLSGSTPFLIGFAVGIYGLMQVLLQIPFGTLSDHIGRKTVIMIGLLLFVAGSVVAAQSTTIFGVMGGRALQGSGAISSALLALTSDLIREEVRARGMAIIGFGMGISFTTALVLGPFLNGWIGGDGLFWVCAGLGGMALLGVGNTIPAEGNISRVSPVLFSRPKSLRWLYAGIFILHFILVSVFLAIPIVLSRVVGENTMLHSGFYALALVLSFVGAYSSIRKREKSAFPLQRGALGLVIGLLCLWQGSHILPLLFLGLLVFFWAFNILEASFPYVLSQHAPHTEKGKLFGVYSTAQFLGAFAGGVGGGWLSGHFGTQAVFGFSVVMAGLSYLVAFKIQNTVIKNNLSKNKEEISWQEESTK